VENIEKVEEARNLSAVDMIKESLEKKDAEK